MEYTLLAGGNVRVVTSPSVKGLVEVGKLLVEPQDGTEQVQYTQRQEPSSTNYIFIE